MADVLSLIESTAAYGIISGEKRAGRIAHAYLIIHPDGDALKEFIKVFAEIILSESGKPSFNERCVALIEKGIHPDVFSYPTDKDVVLTEDVTGLINESVIKPIESDKKIFIINRAETMNSSAQNKLLKTLEEPPKNTVIFLGSTTEYALLPTVRSRVRKLYIPPFAPDALYIALKDDCPDLSKLKTAIACGDGTVKKAADNYHDEKLQQVVDTVCEVITDMKSSKNVLFYSQKLSSLKYDAIKLLGVMKTVFRDMLVSSESRGRLANNPVALEKVKNAGGYESGALIFALEKISDAENRLNSNAAEEAVIERLLFQILEGKYKWRKS